MKPTHFWLLVVVALFLFRLAFGLASEFWFPDELQIYLIGLKSFCLRAWPFFGPDVVYTHTQIPGALQGLLVGGPFFLLKMPESPFILLNLMGAVALAFFAFYLKKRLPELPFWLLVGWLFTCPWTMGYGTRVVNPSYVLPFSLLFFVAFFETSELLGPPLFSRKWSWFWLGFAVTCIWQLHMSWLLLGPFCLFSLFKMMKNDLFSWKNKFETVGIFAVGFLVGGATLWPTLLRFGFGGTGQNIVFNPENWQNAVVVLTRFLSFASFEIPYWLGGFGEEKIDTLRDQIWLWPIVVVLVVVGWAQVGWMIFAFFKKNATAPLAWLRVKWLAAATFFWVFGSFFFSVKGPSSHTFYVVFPIAMTYSFYSYALFFHKKRWIATVFASILAAGVLFHVGVGLHNFKVRSLYLDRSKIQKALDERDYKIVGTRRADELGRGF